MESVQPILDVVARSRGQTSNVLAHIGPIRSFDLSGPVEEVIRDLAARDITDFHINCMVDVVDVPELRLPPKAVAEMASRRADFEVTLRSVPAAPHLAGDDDVPEIEGRFSIGGRGFDPGELTRLTGLTPDSAKRAGERVSRSGVRSPRIDVWSVWGGARRATDFALVIDALLARVSPSAGVIKGFVEAHQLTATFELIGHFVRFTPHLVVRHSQFTEIAVLRAGLWYDLYKRDDID